MREDTIPLMFFSRANKYGSRCALKVKRDGIYRDVSWSEFENKVRDFAYGLLSLGVKPGDKIGLLSENRPEWAYSDLAILSIGCADVPLYSTDVANQIGYMLNNSDSNLVIVSNQEQLNKVLSVRSGIPAVKKIIVMEHFAGAEGGDILSFDDVIKTGRENAARFRVEFESRLQSVKKETLASIIYTSGTTGLSKGVCLTHDNFLANCHSSQELLPLGENEVSLSFLPLSHVFERMASYYFTIFIGGAIAYAENLEAVSRNLREVRPTYVCSAPRFYEKMHFSIVSAIAQSPALKRSICGWALSVGKKYLDKKLNKVEPGLLSFMAYYIAKTFVFSELKKAIGGRIKFFISGGAPLSKELAEFFYSVGILILEGYGLTETSPVVTCNTVKAFKFGSVGRPIKDVEMRIAADGEILVSGRNVMQGYYKNEMATREAIDNEGWLHTGDIGFIDEEGYLHITDRKKDIIITSSGKNIAPQNIENLIKSDSYVQEVVLYGDRRPYLTALVVPNFDALKGLAIRYGIPYLNDRELASHPRVYEFFQKRMDERQKDLANYEKIKKFTLFNRNFTIDNGEITPTLKVKRKVVCEKYKEIFDGMYESQRHI